MTQVDNFQLQLLRALLNIERQLRRIADQGSNSRPPEKMHPCAQCGTPVHDGEGTLCWSCL